LPQNYPPNFKEKVLAGYISVKFYCGRFPKKTYAFSFLAKACYRLYFIHGLKAVAIARNKTCELRQLICHGLKAVDI